MLNTNILYPIHDREGTGTMKQHKNGFTLIELIVTLAITVLILGVILSMFSFMTNSNKDVNDNLNIQSTAQNIVETVKSELQNASQVTLSTNLVPGTGLDGEYYIFQRNNILYKKVGQASETPISASSEILCNMTFTKSGNILGITVNMLKSGASVYKLSTTVFINNLEHAPATTAIVTEVLTGNSLTYSKRIKSLKYVQSLIVTSSTDLITENNGELQMGVSVLPVDATNKNIYWSVKAGTGNAAISPTGKLKALRNGTVTVVATTADGSAISASKIITMSNQTVKATDLVVQPSSQLIYGPGSITISAFALPQDTSNRAISWSLDSYENAYFEIINFRQIKLYSRGLTNMSVIVTAKTTDGTNIVKTVEILMVPYTASTQEP
ncbi:MAG: hypothetical protein BGN88_04220 [Clostridiales bacterium 43-6]|nr:MAG: hypothetical protein BGN88_04220 [Clostridiales bacterium 43-6]